MDDLEAEVADNDQRLKAAIAREIKLVAQVEAIRMQLALLKVQSPKMETRSVGAK